MDRFYFWNSIKLLQNVFEEMDKIDFLVTNRFGDFPAGTKNTVILTLDDWNDYSYYTLYGIHFLNEKGNSVNIGSVRIGYFGQQEGRENRLLKLNDRFENLESDCFSLGTEDTYYENLNELGDEIRDIILIGLNDIALKPTVFEEAKNEQVTRYSHLRDISESTVTNQFRRIALGGVRLTDYSFSYYFPQDKITTKPLKIDFEVIAENNPPTNIQVIIGRNGVGKSHLLNGMIDSVIKFDNEKTSGKFVFNKSTEAESFSNLICVTFSAFDEFDFHNKNPNAEIKYHYIGLRNLEKIAENKNESKFADEFTSSIGFIISSSKKARWKRTIIQLESDPIFKNENFAELIDSYNSKDLKPIQDKFSRLSSGHKIILLTITKLVSLLQEKSLVFFDEPETHLHPPLLSSFVRAISELLINRNAVAIMATHSPIVLQEVPRSCVYKLSKNGSFAKYEKLQLETFGENISVLTNDIFGLEITDSGFFKILKDLTKNNSTYEEALESVDNQIGIEGRAILRSLFFDKNGRL